MTDDWHYVEFEQQVDHGWWQGVVPPLGDGSGGPSASVIGYYLLRRPFRTAEVHGVKHGVALLTNLAVDVAYQSEGYGSRLLRLAVKDVLEAKGHALEADVRPAGPNGRSAEGFYRRPGFKRYGGMRWRRDLRNVSPPAAADRHARPRTPRLEMINAETRAHRSPAPNSTTERPSCPPSTSPHPC